MKVLSKLQRYGLAIISCGVALAVAWPIDAHLVSFSWGSAGVIPAPLHREV